MSEVHITAAFFCIIMGLAAQYPFFILVEHLLIKKALEGSGADPARFSKENPKPVNPFRKFVSFNGLIAVIANWSAWTIFYLIFWG